MRSALLLVLSLAFVPSARPAEWLRDLDAARAAARAQAKPILVDFEAVWCYSCYYMAKHVLGRDAFRDAAAGLVLLKLDVDTPEGKALKESHRVTFLPSYLLLAADGRELGRIIGEQTEADFLRRLKELTVAPRTEAAEDLRRLLDAGLLEEAARRRDELAASAGTQASFRLLSARLDLLVAAKAKKAAEAAAALERLLELEEGCALAYDALRATDYVAQLPSPRRGEILGKARSRLEALVRRGVLGEPAARCADLRSPVEALAEVYEKLELPEERSRLLGDTLAALRGLQRSSPVGEDRNLDDNLRVFLEMGARDAELAEFYPRLIAAYPADYVYSYRYARWLLGKGKAAEALSHADRAERLSYGANRLSAAKVRSDVLSAVGRKADARALLEREIKANRARFPQEVQRLEAALKAL